MPKGDLVIVFDSNAWLKSQDKQAGDFYRSAIVIEERLNKTKGALENEILVDVLFDDGTISKGHFKTGVTYLQIAPKSSQKVTWIVISIVFALILIAFYFMGSV